jgi:hypothetical protein
MKVLFNGRVEMLIEVEAGEDAFRAAIRRINEVIVGYLSAQSEFEITRVVVDGGSYRHGSEQAQEGE